MIGKNTDNEGAEGERSIDLKSRRSFHRKKVCRFCADTENVLDYKDARLMQTFLTERGKMVPRRISGNCAGHQRKLTVAVKRSRHLAMIGFVTPGPLL
jgi:small subunit ribosomal protein S18